MRPAGGEGSLEELAHRRARAVVGIGGVGGWCRATISAFPCRASELAVEPVGLVLLDHAVLGAVGVEPDDRHHGAFSVQ